VNEVEICERVMNIGQFDCFLLAGRYSLLEQDPMHQFLPKCEEHGASIILGGPYNSGILATGVHGKSIPHYNYSPAPKYIIDRVAKIEAVCTQYQVTLAAAALQFPLGHPAVSSVIPGLGSAKRVKHTVELFNEVIPHEFWQTLKDKNLLDHEAPLPSTVINAS
jgi:D-threo-aldose 1-dehydrogenase